MNGKFVHLFFLLLISSLLFSQPTNNKLFFGVAYYYEYMPYDRMEKDVAMMKEAGGNVVSIAEPTWGTVQTQGNVFDFKHIDSILDSMYKGDITSEEITEQSLKKNLQNTNLWKDEQQLSYQ
jgi:beta-galactosidase